MVLCGIGGITFRCVAGSGSADAVDMFRGMLEEFRLNYKEKLNLTSMISHSIDLRCLTFKLSISVSF